MLWWIDDWGALSHGAHLPLEFRHIPAKVDLEREAYMIGRARYEMKTWSSLLENDREILNSDCTL